MRVCAFVNMGVCTRTRSHRVHVWNALPALPSPPPASGVRQASLGFEMKALTLDELIAKFPTGTTPSPSNFSKVSCGGHYASRCEDCPGLEKRASYCNGDCKWQVGTGVEGCVPVTGGKPSYTANGKASTDAVRALTTA